MLRGRCEAACLSDSSKIRFFYPIVAVALIKKTSCVISFVQTITNLQPLNKEGNY